MARFSYPKIQEGAIVKYADLNSQVNGSNTVFTVPENYENGTLYVFFNGIMQTRGDGYSETTVNTFTFSFTPQSGENVIILYTPS